jgi:hypothetical protein
VSGLVAFEASGGCKIVRVATATASKAIRFTRISCHLKVRLRRISTIVRRRHEQHQRTINTINVAGAGGFGC